MFLAIFYKFLFYQFRQKLFTSAIVQIYSEQLFQFSLGPALVSSQSLRITSTVSMQLRAVKYHTLSCNTTQLNNLAIWLIMLAYGRHFEINLAKLMHYFQ